MRSLHYFKSIYTFMYLKRVAVGNKYADLCFLFRQSWFGLSWPDPDTVVFFIRVRL